MGSCTFSPALDQPYRIGRGTCIPHKERVPGKFHLLLPVRRQRAGICLHLSSVDHRPVGVTLTCSKPRCFDGQESRPQRGLHRSQAAALTPAPTAPPKSKTQPWQDGRHGVTFSSDELLEATGKLSAWSRLVYADC